MVHPALHPPSFALHVNENRSKNFGLQAFVVWSHLQFRYLKATYAIFLGT